MPRGLFHPGAWGAGGFETRPYIGSSRMPRGLFHPGAWGAGGFETRPYIRSSRMPDLRQTRTLPWKTSCAGPVM